MWICRGIPSVGGLSVFPRILRAFPRSAITLLTLSHIVMGAFSLPLLGLIWPARWPSFSSYAFPLFGGTLFYLLAQAALFLALRTATASRTSPLLGLKIFILAIISVLAFDDHLVACQWLAIVMSMVAAAMLNWSGGSMPWRSIVWVLLACVGYSLSDLNVKALVGQFDYLGLTYASTVSVCLCYLLCSAAGHRGVAVLSGRLHPVHVDLLPAVCLQLVPGHAGSVCVLWRHRGDLWQYRAIEPGCHVDSSGVRHRQDRLSASGRADHP